MRHLIIILAIIGISSTVSAQWKEYPIQWRQYKGTAYTDSAARTILSEAVDTTTWVSTLDSTGSRGFRAFIAAIGTSDATASVAIQFGLLNPTSKAYVPMKYTGYTYPLDSLYDLGGAAGLLVMKNPKGYDLWNRAKNFPGATVWRFIVTWGAVTESGTAYAIARAIGPKL